MYRFILSFLISRTFRWSSTGKSSTDYSGPQILTEELYGHTKTSGRIHLKNVTNIKKKKWCHHGLPESPVGGDYFVYAYVFFLFFFFLGIITNLQYNPL